MTKSRLLDFMPVGILSQGRLSSVEKVIAAAMLFALLGNLSLADDLELAVTAQPSRASEPFEIAFTIQNHSEKQMVLARENVPWLFPYAPFMEWKAMATNQSAGIAIQLKMEKPIVDPPIGAIQLKPREVVSGKLDLRRLFPAIQSALGTNDVEVCWTCRMGKTKSPTEYKGRVLLKKLKDR